MKEQIVEILDIIIDELKLVKSEVENGTPERIDALDVLEFVGIGVDSAYQEIKSLFNLKEDEA